MKKMLVIALTTALALGLFAAPSALAKKKKKKPAPVSQTITFTEEGTISVPAPSSLAFGGVTETEFTANGCASMPASQGVDGHVVELPEDYRTGTATLEVVGSDATGAYDLDVYFYDSSCSLMDPPYLTDGSNPTGPIPGGATWAVVDLFTGANASFKLTATTTKLVSL